MLHRDCGCSIVVGLLLNRNIEELQEQNQKLLAVVRELSDAQEEKEMQCGDTKLVHHV